MCKHNEKDNYFHAINHVFSLKMCSYHLELNSSHMCTRLITDKMKFLLKNKLSHTHIHTHSHKVRKFCVQALWDDICGNSFRIHFNALCKPKCQSSFLVSFHDFMSHIKRCSLLHNGLFKLHYRRIFPSKEN